MKTDPAQLRAIRAQLVTLPADAPFETPAGFQLDVVEDLLEAQAARAALDDLKRRLDERDAAVKRVPVADTIHSVHAILDAEEALAGRAGVRDRARSALSCCIAACNSMLLVSDAIDRIREKVRDLPGWDGTEGGFKPGMQTTHYVLRDTAKQDREALAAAAESFIASVVDDLGEHGLKVCARTVGACTDLRRAIAASRGAP